MKHLMLIVFAMSICNLAKAQTASAALEKMKPFQSWVGHWKGNGSIRMGPGEPKKSNVDEHLELKLDGTILVMEGIGKSIDASGNEFVSHHAYGVLAYDQVQNQYKLNTYLIDGKMADAWLKITSENHYQWGFDTPQGKVRYSITIDLTKKTWNEVGEFSSDGNNWMPFFEMNLSKLD